VVDVCTESIESAMTISVLEKWWLSDKKALFKVDEALAVACKFNLKGNDYVSKAITICKDIDSLYAYT
jgi:hypothetical protein